MGNCDRKAFVDDTAVSRKMSPTGDSTADSQDVDPIEELDNLVNRPFSFKKEISAVDHIYVTVRNLIPKALLSTEISKFTSLYRIKKNIKCENNIIYQVNVLEQKSNGNFFLAKMITREKIRKFGESMFTILLNNEIRALNQLDNPNVETLYKVYLLPYKNNFKLILITNYVSPTSLHEIINEHIQQQKRFTDKEIGILAKNLIATLYYLKSQNIIHRNLSPENIFFKKKGDFTSLSIRNFYFCSILGRIQTATGIFGGLWFMAPEMLRDIKYDYKLDIWSVGLILYIMITLENPFSDCETRDMMLDKLKHKQVFKNKEELQKFGINPEIFTFCIKMLSENPALRTTSELLLEDDFIKYITNEEKKDENQNNQMEIIEEDESDE